MLFLSSPLINPPSFLTYPNRRSPTMFRVVCEDIRKIVLLEHSTLEITWYKNFARGPSDDSRIFVEITKTYENRIDANTQKRNNTTLPNFW